MAYLAGFPTLDYQVLNQERTVSLYFFTFIRSEQEEGDPSGIVLSMLFLVFFFNPSLFFVQGAAFGDINPALFVAMTRLHTSRNLKYAVKGISS